MRSIATDYHLGKSPLAFNYMVASPILTFPAFA